MSLLREIQQSLLQGEKIGPILLKLRYLASRLGSDPLEEWVKHESEGYPPGTAVPEYRKVSVTYTGTFSGPFGSGISNAPIPPYLVEKFAGKQWNDRELRQSLSAIESLIGEKNDGGEVLHIDSANLMLVLQGKVYEDFACNGVTGNVPCVALAEIQNVVRARVLELTIQLEKSIPGVSDITLGSSTTAAAVKNPEAVTQITQQIIFGDVTTISSTGEGAQFLVNVQKGDKDALLKAFIDAGITKSDATELAGIIASEQPESKDQPLGAKARTWLAKNIGKAASGAWKITLDVATKIVTEAALRYYGLK